MEVMVKPELSMKNKYWIDKHRYYELKHFCLQYPKWKKIYSELSYLGMSLSSIELKIRTNIPSDLTGKYAMMKSHYSYYIKLVEDAANSADNDLNKYILKAVTEGLSYASMKTRFDIPCSRDTYYDRYRRFFWILNDTRK